MTRSYSLECWTYWLMHNVESSIERMFTPSFWVGIAWMLVGSFSSKWDSSIPRSRFCLVTQRSSPIYDNHAPQKRYKSCSLYYYPALSSCQVIVKSDGRVINCVSKATPESCPQQKACLQYKCSDFACNIYTTFSYRFFCCWPLHVSLFQLRLEWTDVCHWIKWWSRVCVWCESQ